MKRWIILAAVVVALASTATVALQFLPDLVSPEGKVSFPVGGGNDKETTAKPKAVLEGEPVFNFGTMPQQATGKHSWVVRNEGEGTLELWMISSTCSCTLAKFKDGEKAYVKPGESTEITLEFETRANSGEYEKGAEIGTNDPRKPQFPLHVHGKVYPAVMILPPLEGNTVNLMDIRNDEPDHISKLVFYSKDRPEMKIVKVTSSDPRNIVTSWESLKEDDLKAMKLEGAQQLTLNVKSGMPLGRFRHEVKVTTDHPKQAEVVLTVTGTLLGPVSVGNPGRLMIHNPPANGKTGDHGEIDLLVAGNRETSFEVVKTPRGLSAEVVPGDRKGHYRLVVTIPPGTAAQNIIGDIQLKTDHPNAGSVFVPVNIWITHPQ